MQPWELKRVITLAGESVPSFVNYFYCFTWQVNMIITLLNPNVMQAL